jgi:regulator of protease activity HflC (stomatin/prohibitin superfamily)
MKLITVYANEVAFITKRGKLINVLLEGRHWIGFWEDYEKISNQTPIVLNTDTWIEYIKFEPLASMLAVVEIKDNEIGIEFKNGLYNRVLSAGRIAYWRDSIPYSIKIYNTDELEVPHDISKVMLAKPGLMTLIKVYVVESYQKGLLYIDGKFEKVLDAGIYNYWKGEKIAVVKAVDMRTQSLAIAGQEILTKDKAGIRLSFQAQYQITDIVKAINDNKDAEIQLYTAFQLILREYIGGMTLDQLLDSKEAIGPYIVNAVKTTAEDLGMEVKSGGIKDIILPGDVKEIMNQVLIAQKKAQANSIMRQEETAATRSLMNTAKLMEDNTMLMKLKEMEYMEKIADKIGEITINGGNQVLDQMRTLMIGK